MIKIKTQPPKIHKRRHAELEEKIRRMVPFYTPGWEPGEGDAGAALISIFSYLAGLVIERLNQAPYKYFVAFLDMLGMQLQPAQPSTVPLHFKLAKGVEKGVLIPVGTMAAAGKTEEHGEIPFETVKNLLAVPGTLQKAISIDPEADAIYIPPPGFTAGEIRGVVPVSYKIVSSPSAGAKNFQLDHVIGLEEGDFLKIGIGNDIKYVEYVIISAIKGNIVFISQRLGKEFPVGTPVEKLAAFSLFEGKNMQEHSLYLGHQDLFNIKSKANFSLTITHRDATGADITGLGVSWEYWGEGDKEGEGGEDWYPFNSSAKTNVLSKDEEIELNKVIAGEIKEKEINGIKSRWIRCRLDDQLTVSGDGKLPVLDNIVFKVSSLDGNGKLSPDQAFNNEIPLDISGPFNPFGKEPRMYDTFSIAGKEIFSKKGAAVTFDVDVEPRGIAGPPAAILFTDSSGPNKIKVFARGTYGRLMELEIYPKDGREKTHWTDHGFPAGTTIASCSTPAIKKLKNNGITVFARTGNGRLFERFYNGNQWQWLDHGNPVDNGKDISLQFDPAAVFIKEKTEVAVFVAGSDGNLYQFYRSLAGDKTLGQWIKHGLPKGTAIDSSPYAEYYPDASSVEQVDTTSPSQYNKQENQHQHIVVVREDPTRIKVFFKGQNGKLYELDCKAGTKDAADKTIEYEFPGNGTGTDPVKVDSKPFAKYYREKVKDDVEINYAKVLVKGDDGQLWEFDTKHSGVTGSWTPLGTPDENKDIKVFSAPHGYIIYPENDREDEDKHIFVRGTDKCLWERSDENWKRHYSPPNSTLYLSPFVLYSSSQEVLYVFSASSQNSIIEKDNSETWNEYKDSSEEAITPTLSWEYWNKNGWVVIGGINDGTANLLNRGKITFTLPNNIEETQVAGQKNYWIRARIVGGDYGKETYSFVQDYSTGSQQIISTKKSIRPPLINKIEISYNYKDETELSPEHCLTYNNLEYRVCTEESKTAGKHFSPFKELEEKRKTLYLGFDQFFKGGPIKIFFNARGLEITDITVENKPKLAWTYSRKNDWEEMSSNDYTEALIKAEILEFIGEADFSPRSIFGQYLYWLKGSLEKGEYEEMPQLHGIYPNTTRGIQGKTFTEEILGSGSGEPHQTFTFLNRPVQKGQEIRVREIITREEKEALIKAGARDTVVEVTGKDGNGEETWVLWTEVPNFFESGQKDRHYTLDPAPGMIRFGDGINGMIPPLGENNIKAFTYQSGGGTAGNVKAGEITALKTAVAGVDGLINPMPAEGGADTATLDRILEIGPALINHRNRAVTPADFERLAKQATRKIVKARCLPNTNNEKKPELGWVTVIIVPDLPAPRPYPSPQLRGIVQKYLEAHSANTLTRARHIHIDGPGYAAIGVTVQVFVTSMEAATRVESAVRKTLEAFFHPLTGGPEGSGWDFGRDVTASDVYAKLEEIAEVDHVENLKFTRDRNPIQGEIVEIGDDILVCSGTHNIEIKKQQGG
jgi:hypothetical protein